MGKGQVSSDKDKRLKVKVTVQQKQQIQPKSFEWWIAQSRLVDGGSCPKCQNMTFGQYIPPSRGTMNECAVIEKCRVCGWEHPILTGMSGVPYDEQPERPRSALKMVGASRPVKKHLILPGGHK